MIYIDQHSMSPFMNFAVEEYFMNEKDLGDDHLFMFWRTTPTLMVGRFQNTIEEINSKYVEENKVLVVRRNSGGGTIYTDEGTWQFSFIIKNYEKNRTSFQYFTKPIIQALQKIGVDAQFNSRNDLMIGGKKFSGNAQYRKKNAMIHHGSMLYQTNLAALVKSIVVSEDKIISKGIKSVRERVTNISEHMPEVLSIEEFKEWMVRSILSESDGSYLPTPEDWKRIEEISRNKFESWEWNYGHSPKFDIERKKRYLAGAIQTKLKVVNGMIVDCKIQGDFFETGDIRFVEESLIGLSYSKYDIMKVIESENLHENFYSITKEELLNSVID